MIFAGYVSIRETCSAGVDCCSWCASQLEVYVRLHVSAATLSSFIKRHLNLKYPLKTAFNLHPSFSLVSRMHIVYPSCPPMTQNPLHTFQFTKKYSNWKMNQHWARSISLCNARKTKNKKKSLEMKICFLLSCKLIT